MRSKKTFIQTVRGYWNAHANREEIRRHESVEMIASHYWTEPYLKCMTESQLGEYRSIFSDKDITMLIMKAPELEIMRYISEHGYTQRLASKSRQLIHTDYYGDRKIDGWINELNRFIDDRIWQLTHAASNFPLFMRDLARIYKVECLLEYDRDEIQSAVFNYIGYFTDEYEEETAVVEVNNGFDYEMAIASALERLGFTARLTGGGGDQGVDILADRDELTYAIQCKYYSSPVGNAAVQQVHSGAGYYGADVAVVVTNSTYTKAALQLADSLCVILLDDQNLDIL